MEKKERKGSQHNPYLFARSSPKKKQGKVPLSFSTLPDWPSYDKDAFLRSLHSRGDAFLKLAKRPKLAAWIMSNCAVPSQREDY